LSENKEVLEQSVEEELSQLLEGLEETRNAIVVVQSRINAIAGEINEIRMALEALNAFEKFQERSILVSLDRSGYAFIRAEAKSIDSVIVRLTRDFYMSLPISKARETLLLYEKDLSEALRDANIELQKLMDLYNKIQERIRLLAEKARQQK